jgi:hypothetical protein
MGTTREFVAGEVAVPFALSRTEYKEQSSPESMGAVGLDAQGASQTIGSAEANTPEVSREPIGVRSHDLD